MSKEVVKVFISYSWDSEEHKKKILSLSQSLRENGIDCQIDRYQSSPPEGWYRWMMDQIEESDFVLVVCSEKYNLRYQNKEEQGQGRGATWEGGLIIAELYEGQGVNDKFIPVLFSPDGEKHIPRSLQTYTVYRIFSNDNYDLNKAGDYQNLYRHLTQQPAYVPAPLGELKILRPISGTSSTVGNYGEIVQAGDSKRQSWLTTITDELASEKGVNYTRLRDLLKASQWKEADQETAKRMCEVMGRQKEGKLRVEDIESFPCTDLRTIDQLWVKHSKGKFGFSVQKKIWQDCDIPAIYKTLQGYNIPIPTVPTINIASWMKFCGEVGWQKKGSRNWKHYNELTFDLDAPEGHLPVGCFLGSWFLSGIGLMVVLLVWFGLGSLVSSLASRLGDCSIE